ncbi:hypothetical protein SAMD00023353_0901180 [Rosellinia necatrix]|uniref:Uncharacterized protein n=1 Tax=Rosellinia necatrix TaxID=77044 RepID=A0A1W2THN2_ROSNE|nr:hypothetical protein SAMD00023353_0901180 [Rosellinia necatrix]
MAGVTSYSGYYQEPAAAFSQPMAYQPEYGQDNRQTQGYSTYNTSMLYNVQQTGAQNTVYDTSQQFPSRQAAGLQMMPTDVASPYFPSESASAATAAGLQPQTASSSTPAVYQPGYTSNIAPMSGMAQAGTSEQVVEEQEYNTAGSASAPEPTPTAALAQMGEAYEQYQSALREIFTNIHNGVLQTASESLLRVSEWLLSKVVDLGLTGDDEALHQDRIKLWRDFNYAWLSLCQKQLDMLRSSLPPQRNQNVLAKDQLKKMGDEVTRLCNSIERHGLVDYECGVWEEQIIEIILQCLEEYDTSYHESSSSVSRPSGVGRPSHLGSR